jgi:16S rRNA G1207 methylase RsmC
MLEPKLMYIAATCASDGSMLMAGTSASGGRSARTWFTRVLMSASASAAGKFNFSRTLMVERPWTL